MCTKTVTAASHGVLALASQFRLKFLKVRERYRRTASFGRIMPKAFNACALNAGGPVSRRTNKASRLSAFTCIDNSPSLHAKNGTDIKRPRIAFTDRGGQIFHKMSHATRLDSSTTIDHQCMACDEFQARYIFQMRYFCENGDTGWRK